MGDKSREIQNSRDALQDDLDQSLHGDLNSAAKAEGNAAGCFTTIFSLIAFEVANLLILPETGVSRELFWPLILLLQAPEIPISIALGKAVGRQIRTERSLN